MRTTLLSRSRSVRTIVCAFAVIAALGWAPSQVQAADVINVTYTGADLLGLGSAYFPSGRATQIIDGTSLFFFESTTPGDKWEKLLVLPLDTGGTIPTKMSVVMDLTKIPPLESDPHIMIGDGNRVVGVTVLDVDPTEGGTDTAVCTDQGVTCGDMDYRRIIDSPSPSDGVPYTVRVDWTLGTSTRVEASLFWMSGGGDISPGLSLDPTAPLSFVFLSDNQPHERYQINWLSIRVEAQGLTCSCSNPGFFDPPMDRDITVKKGNRVLPLKFTLCDENGVEVTDLDISPPMAQVMYLGQNPGVPLPEEDYLTAGHGDDGNVFDFAGSQWQLNLQTKRFDARGIYEITAVSTDPSFVISPTCSVLFEIE